MSKESAFWFTLAIVSFCFGIYAIAMPFYMRLADGEWPWAPMTPIMFGALSWVLCFTSVKIGLEEL